jgi:NADH-quinone oxidoreductase subunit E
MTLDKTLTDKIDNWCKKYPKTQQKSAIMEALRLAQVANNNVLTANIVKEVADYLQIPHINALEVATFYENYNLDIPTHKYQIRFCHNISCMLGGADELLSYLEQKLGIKAGEVTQDGKFYLKKVECLGACVGAPMLQIGDNYYEHLTTDKLDDILESL